MYSSTYNPRARQQNLSAVQAAQQQHVISFGKVFKEVAPAVFDAAVVDSQQQLSSPSIPVALNTISASTFATAASVFVTGNTKGESHAAASSALSSPLEVPATESSRSAHADTSLRVADPSSASSSYLPRPSQISVTYTTTIRAAVEKLQVEQLKAAVEAFADYFAVQLGQFGIIAPTIAANPAQEQQAGETPKLVDGETLRHEFEQAADALFSASLSANPNKQQLQPSPLSGSLTQSPLVVHAGARQQSVFNVGQLSELGLVHTNALEAFLSPSHRLFSRAVRKSSCVGYLQQQNQQHRRRATSFSSQSAADSLNLTCHVNVENDDDDDIVQINDYQIIDEAGRGQFGVVKIAMKSHPDEQVYAVKIVAKKKMRALVPQQRSQTPRAQHGAPLSSGDNVAAAVPIWTPVPPQSSPLSQSTRHLHNVFVKSAISDSSATLLADDSSNAADALQLMMKTQVSLPATEKQHGDRDDPPSVNVESRDDDLPIIDITAELPESRAGSVISCGSASGRGAAGSLPSRQVVDSVRREIEVMKTLRHRNIVNLLEVIDDPEDTNLYLVMPYCDRGPIVTLSKEGTCAPLDVDVARGYMRQITAGLAYLHSKHVAHMDIKPDNILLDSSHTCYLSDFGTSEFFVGKSYGVTGLRGTPAFAAPEVWSAESFNPFHADIWSLGVTFYVMLIGKLPFCGENLADLGDNIAELSLAFDISGIVESLIQREDSTAQQSDCAPATMPVEYEDAIDLLSLMLERDPGSRPSASSLLLHPFLARQSKPTSARHRSRQRLDIDHAKVFF